MIYMINTSKKCLVLSLTLFLNSCSFISYNQAIPLIKNAIIGVKDIEITEEYYKNINYSFAKMKIGRSAIAILALISVENGVYEWISDSGERVYTYKGKIFKTEGIIHNFEIINFRDFSLDDDNAYKIDIILDNPLAYSSQNINVITYQEDNNLIVEESIRTASFRWSYENKYWLDDKSKVYKSVQRIHPRLPKIEIDYYYKY